MKVTWSDLRSIQRQILGRLKRDGDTNAVAVGLGVKNAHKRPRNRKLAVVVVVREKVPPGKLTARTRMGKDRRVRVQVGRGKAKKSVTLPTDVITIGRIVPTAAQIRTDDNDGSAGALVWWRKAAPGPRSWGLLTVGHTLAGQPPDIIITPANAAAILGQTVFVTQPGDPYDAGLIKITQADAATLAPELDLNDPPELVPRDFASLMGDVAANQDQGLCLAAGRTEAFDTELAVPGPVDWIETLPNLRTILRVRATPAAGKKPFRPGTSGSPWHEVLQNVPMSFLVGAEPPDFIVGYGQCMRDLAAYVRTAMNATELRLVKMF